MSGLAAGEREQLLVKCWMTHDARWFNAVAREFGMQAANRLNRRAVREMAKVEWQRVGRALGIEQPKDAAGCLAAQQAMIDLLGPELLDYEAQVEGTDACRISVRRCFAHENVEKAGIAAQYDCGIFSRIEGWLEGMGFAPQVQPPLKGCLKAQGKECVHTVRLRAS
ncbi:MAG: DUF6125 family protein [Burkholderiales bacterium]